MQFMYSPLEDSSLVGDFDRFIWITTSNVGDDGDGGSFSRTTQDAKNKTYERVRDQWAEWSMIDDRWSMMPGHVSVSRLVVDRRRSHPLTLPCWPSFEQHETHPPMFNGSLINHINYINLVVNSLLFRRACYRLVRRHLLRLVCLNVV